MNGLGMIASRMQALQERAEKAEAKVQEQAAALARVDALTYASDDGTEYEHYHGPQDGYPECPACWIADIRAAIAGDQS